MKKSLRLVTCLVVIVAIICCNTFGLAYSVDIDYDTLTASELENIIQDATAALEKNHSVSSAVKDTLESKTKASGERLISNQSGSLSWRWLDWTYTRDWDVINVITEVKVDGNWLPLEAKYKETDVDYELVTLDVGGTTVYSASGSDTSVQDNNSGHIIAQKGDKNDTVKEIQSMLIKLGYAKGKAKGVFGDSTEKIVKKFQKKNGLEQTGIVDEATYDALQQATSDSSGKTKTKKKTTQKEQKEPQKQEVKYTRVKAEDLYQAYQDNEIAADGVYKDKVIEVVGEIIDIGKTFGTIHINLKGEPLGLLGVYCSMNDDQTNAVATLKSGQTIIIRGKCTGLALEVMLSNCIIVG